MFMFYFHPMMMVLSYFLLSCSLYFGVTMFVLYLGLAKRICYLSPMRAAKVQASLRIRAVSPEPSLLAHTNSESRETFRQKARSLPPLNGWACAVEFCHDGMLEDTNSLDGAHLVLSGPAGMVAVNLFVLFCFDQLSWMLLIFRFNLFSQTKKIFLFLFSEGQTWCVLNHAKRKHYLV